MFSEALTISSLLQTSMAYGQASIVLCCCAECMAILCNVLCSMPTCSPCLHIAQNLHMPRQLCAACLHYHMICTLQYHMLWSSTSGTVGLCLFEVALACNAGHCGARQQLAGAGCRGWQAAGSQHAALQLVIMMLSRTSIYLLAGITLDNGYYAKQSASVGRQPAADVACM